MVSQDLAKEMAFEMRSKTEPLIQRASKRTFETEGRTPANSLKSTEFALFKDETEDKCGGQRAPKDVTVWYLCPCVSLSFGVLVGAMVCF